MDTHLNQSDAASTANLDRDLANRLKKLRADQNWSLDTLAQKSGVSRATLSRIEHAEVSPTTQVLAKLCSAYGLTLSRLLAMVESGFSPLVRLPEQTVWEDRTVGFRRRVVSAPSHHLSAEIIEGRLKSGARLVYDKPTIPGQEHHVILKHGRLEITLDGQTFDLWPGDCLRYRLFGASEFFANGPDPASYTLVLI